MNRSHRKQETKETKEPKQTKERKERKETKDIGKSFETSAVPLCVPLCVVPTQAQYEVTRYLLHPATTRFVAWWDMGLGKTLLAILFAETNLLYRYPTQTIIPQLCVIVASPTLQKNFESNLLKFGRSHQHIERYYRFWSYEAIALHPSLFADTCRGNLVSADEIQEIFTVITKSKSQSKSKQGKKEEKEEKNQKKKERKAEIITFGGDIVEKGRQAAAFLCGVQHAYKVLALTGTIIRNAQSDLYNLAVLLSSSAGPLSGPFSSLSCSRLQKNTITDTDTKILQSIFTGRISHRTIQNCGLQHKFPKVEEINVLMEMNEDYFEAYQMVEQNEISKLQQRNELHLIGSTPFYSGLRQASNKINGVESQKRQFIMEIVLEAKRNGERVSITSTFLSRGLGILFQSFYEHGIQFVEISGDITSKDERQAAVDKMNDPKCKIDVILLSGAGTTGINLCMTRRQINMESNWNEATRQQTNARIARLDSKLSTVTIYNLLMIKPGQAFEACCREMQQTIGKLGLSTMLMIRPHLSVNRLLSSIQNLSLSVPVPANPTKDKEKKMEIKRQELDKLMSVDVHLYYLQLKKSGFFAPLLNHAIPAWSIERHPEWKSGILPKCPSIDWILEPPDKPPNRPPSIPPNRPPSKPPSRPPTKPANKPQGKSTNKSKNNYKYKNSDGHPDRHLDRHRDRHRDKSSKTSTPAPHISHLSSHHQKIANVSKKVMRLHDKQNALRAAWAADFN